MPEDLNENFNTGYVKIFRSVKENWIWDDPNKLKWWIDILLSVNYTDRKVLIGDTLIDCKRGQSLNSLESWAKRWRVDKSKVRRFFNLLQGDGMIELENVKKTTRLTVCKYASYNDTRNESETIMTQQRHANGTQVTPREESKEREEGKEEENIAKAINGNKFPVKSFKKDETELRREFNQLEIPEKAKDAWIFIRDWITTKKPQFVDPYVVAWNAFSSFYGFPAVSKVNAWRRSKFKTRVKEGDFCFFDILAKVAKSEFLKGSSWFGFDWIIENEMNYVKILEENYK